MPKFSYSAVTVAGERISGEMEALRRDVVIEALNHLGHLPIEIRELPEGGPAGSIMDFRQQIPSRSQVTQMTRELAMLLRAGLPLDPALAMLERTMGSRRMSALLKTLRIAIGDGRSLSQALDMQPKAFSKTYVSMVRVAEESGTLDTVLQRISEGRERDEKLRGKSISALLYPVLLITVGVGAILVMLGFVVPRFKIMLANAAHDLPPSTKAIIAASDWLIANWAYLAAAVFIVVLGLFGLSQLSKTRRWVERAAMATPLVGSIIRMRLTIEFSRGLGLLLENGVDLPRALRLSEDLVAYRSARDALAAASEALRVGQDFTLPLQSSRIFAPAAIELLRVGEATGSLTASAKHIEQAFEDKLETTMARTFTILEPAIIILVSLFVAATILSVISGIISVNDIAL